MAEQTITLTCEVTGDELLKAMKSYPRIQQALGAKPKPKNRVKEFAIGFGLMLLIGILLGVGAHLLDTDINFMQMLVGAWLGIAVMAFVWHRTHTHALNGVGQADAALKRGASQWTFAASGVEVSSRLGASTLAWAGISGIAALPDQTAILSGPIMHVVPNRALPDDLTPEAFRAQLDAWRTAE